MKAGFPIYIFAAGLLWSSSEGFCAQTPSAWLGMPEDLIEFDSKAGQRLMRDSRSDVAFWRLAQFYSPQPDLGSCGVASCNMVLNALPIERPTSNAHGKFRLFTAENF